MKDNIFVRNINIANNGTIKTDISHHKSLFSVSEIEKIGPSKTENDCFKVYYCYSKENLEKLSSYLLSNLEQTNPTNISELAEIIQRSIDEACKLRNPKSSKRNSQNNPWISKGLINSIAKRDRLQSCAISIRQSRILFFFPIENCKASVQFKLIYFIQIKR